MAEHLSDKLAMNPEGIIAAALYNHHSKSDVDGTLVKAIEESTAVADELRAILCLYDCRIQVRHGRLAFVADKGD